MRKPLYETKEELYEKVAEQVRWAYVQDIDSETRKSTIYGALFHGFDEFLLLRAQKRYNEAKFFKIILGTEYFLRKVLRRQFRRHKKIYYMFFNKLFHKLPELNLGEEVSETAWQYILQPLTFYLSNF